jgi:membrane protein YdbS with pleckstrin-like domain
MEMEARLILMENFRPIARAARIIWGLTGIGVISLFGAICAVSASLASSTATIAVLAVTLVVDGWWWWISGRRWRAWGYAERDNDLVIKRGVMTRHLTIVPYGRMQFVDTKQGPLERLLGVSTVVLNTAAAATDARIPMVDDQEAQRLREQLTRLGVANATGL